MIMDLLILNYPCKLYISTSTTSRRRRLMLNRNKVTPPTKQLYGSYVFLICQIILEYLYTLKYTFIFFANFICIGVSELRHGTLMSEVINPTFIHFTKSVSQHIHVLESIPSFAFNFHADSTVDPMNIECM